MRHEFVTGVLSLLLPVLLAAGCVLGLSRCGPDSSLPPECAFDFGPYLPDPDRLGDWRPAGDPRVFEGDDLYAFINGGAEIYHEYGFERVVVQGFSGDEGGRITLEIYEMDSHAAAYGIWSTKRGSEGRPLALGGGGVMYDYYAYLWKGPFLITLTAFDERQKTVDGLKVIASAVDAALMTESRAPDLVDLLGAEGVAGRSVVYMTGPIAWFNCHRFFTRDIFEAKEIVKGASDEGCVVFVFAYGGDTEAAQRFGSVSGVFRNSGEYSEFSGADGAFSAVDKEGRILEACLTRRFILLTSSDPKSGGATSFRARLVKRIAAFR